MTLELTIEEGTWMSALAPQQTEISPSSKSQETAKQKPHLPQILHLAKRALPPSPQKPQRLDSSRIINMCLTVASLAQHACIYNCCIHCMIHMWHALPIHLQSPTGQYKTTLHGQQSKRSEDQAKRKDLPRAKDSKEKSLHERKNPLQWTQLAQDNRPITRLKGDAPHNHPLQKRHDAAYPS
jgi:hypothetical protein